MPKSIARLGLRSIFALTNSSVSGRYSNSGLFTMYLYQGLGLWTSKLIIERLNGTISAKNMENSGVKIEIKLPLWIKEND